MITTKTKKIIIYIFLNLLLFLYTVGFVFYLFSSSLQYDIITIVNYKLELINSIKINSFSFLFHILLIYLIIYDIKNKNTLAKYFKANTKNSKDYLNFIFLWIFSFACLLSIIGLYSSIKDYKYGYAYYDGSCIIYTSVRNHKYDSAFRINNDIKITIDSKSMENYINDLWDMNETWLHKCKSPNISFMYLKNNQQILLDTIKLK